MSNPRKKDGLTVYVATEHAIRLRDAMQALEDTTYTPADYEAFYALHAGRADVGELMDRLERTFG